jgi:hypothetical protein
METSFVPSWLASQQHLQGHSEIADDVTHQECQIGRMDYERGEVRTDSFPRLHIHRDSLLHSCGTNNNIPPPDRIIKILSRVRQLSALKFCQAREFLSLLGLLNSASDQIPHGRLYLRPLQLLLTLQMETTSGSSGSGSSPSRILTTRSLEFLGLRGLPQTGSAIAFIMTFSAPLADGFASRWLR